MSPWRRGGADLALRLLGGGIDVLSDDALQRLLSFLPAHDAVRTCVLARRWSHLSKSATGLRIMGRDDGKGGPAASVEALREFVFHLLLLRGGSSLDTCELSFGDFDHGDVMSMVSFDDFHRRGVRCVTLWVQHVLLCKVQVLRLNTIVLNDQPLVSHHLRRLELTRVVLKTSFCNLMTCPSLEHLEISDSYLCVEKITSKSLKYMIIKNCGFNRNQGFRTLIYVLSLVSLSLDGQM